MNQLRVTFGPTGNVYLTNVRDRTNTVVLSPEDWAEFVTAVKARKFDRPRRRLDRPYLPTLRDPRPPKTSDESVKDTP